MFERVEWRPTHPTEILCATYMDENWFKPPNGLEEKIPEIMKFTKCFCIGLWLTFNILKKEHAEWSDGRLLAHTALVLGRGFYYFVYWRLAAGRLRIHLPKPPATPDTLIEMYLKPFQADQRAARWRPARVASDPRQRHLVLSNKALALNRARFQNLSHGGGTTWHRKFQLHDSTGLQKSTVTALGLTINHWTSRQ